MKEGRKRNLEKEEKEKRLSRKETINKNRRVP